MTSSYDIPVTSAPAFSAGLTLKLRWRLFAARLMAAAGLDSDRRRHAEALFIEVTRSQGNLIASICLSFAESREEFEDMRQDALLNIWRGIGNFREDSSLSTWVYRVTLNTCVSYQRKKKTGAKDAETFNEFYRELFDESSAEDIERYELMYRLIARLSPLDKSVLLMWLDDKSYDEITEVTGMSRNAVASRLKRAKDRLADMAAQTLNY